MIDAAIISTAGVIIAAGISAWVATRAARQHTKTEIETAQVKERAELRNFLAEQISELRKETDALRVRVRGTETELADCVKKHLQAEMALLRAGIQIGNKP